MDGIKKIIATVLPVKCKDDCNLKEGPRNNMNPLTSSWKQTL